MTTETTPSEKITYMMAMSRKEFFRFKKIINAFPKVADRIGVFEWYDVPGDKNAVMFTYDTFQRVEFAAGSHPSIFEKFEKSNLKFLPIEIVSPGVPVETTEAPTPPQTWIDENGLLRVDENATVPSGATPTSAP